jgi:hypothetical protein
MALPAPPMPRMMYALFFVDVAGVMVTVGACAALTKLPAPPMPEERKAGTL